MRKLIKKQWFSLIILLLMTGLSQNLFSQSVNTSGTVTWPFSLGTANQVATYSTGTADYFNQDYVSKGSNLTFKDFRLSTIDGVTYTRFQPLVQNNSVTANDHVYFNILPKTGISFTPTALTFKCMRYGTDGGKIDVAWISSDGTTTVAQTAISPNRDNNTAGGSLVSINLSTLSIPASTGECKLRISIYSLGNTKQIGLANIVVTGNITGSLVSVQRDTLTTAVSPSGAGTVALSPVGPVFDSGSEVTMTATANFGYSFSHWKNASETNISSANPFVFNINQDTTITAVFNTLNTYKLEVGVQGGAKSYMVTASPAATVVSGNNMYVEGTNVTLTASNNPIMSFSNWNTGETTSTLQVPMNENKQLTAVYSAVDYVAGWDFYNTGGSSRVADFYSKDENQTSTLILRKADGTLGSWLDKSQVAAGGYEGRPAAVNWRPLVDQYYYQISFDATAFKDMTMLSAMLYNYNAYSVQKIEYSLDNTSFTELDQVSMSSAKVWYEKTVTLPAACNHASRVYLRWIPDYTSTVVGTTSSNDGTAISGIYVFGTEEAVNDGTAPVLASSVPAANATGASATGKVVLNFDEKVQIVGGTTASLGSKTLTPVVSGKTITFNYTGLDYNTIYSFNLPANTVSDLFGNALSTAISFSFTTAVKPVVTKKLFDFVVGVDGNFSAAMTAANAASSTGERFRIFFPNGDYNVGTQTGDANQKTTIALPNVSFVGQHADSVFLYNQNTTEGIGSTATLCFTNTANSLYLQDLSLKNKDFRSGSPSLGRCVALQDQGTKNIYKNVNLLSNQDTYYSGSGRSYFEGGRIHGTVDFICGGGDVFFNETMLYLEERSGNCITAPATASSWGYVFSNCTIDGFAINSGSYNLGRPWQNSPRSIYLNTTMKVLPTAAGWTEMGVVPGKFGEYNSLTATGSTVDLTNRKKSFTYSGVTTTVDPYITAEQAVDYTLINVLGGTDTWQPNQATDQAAVPVVSLSGRNLSWDDNNYVLCWAVFKNNQFVQFTTSNSYAIPESVSAANYTIRSANEMGGLSESSNVKAFSSSGYTGVDDVKALPVSQTYYSLEGKRIANLSDFTGTLIVRTIYSDGSVKTTKRICLK